jgi:organic hydroperoxide reductase OsmC/OhrA
LALYRADIAWSLQPGEDFIAGRYSRGHAIAFGGGLQASGTASPHVVGPRWSVAGAVDPEEMLVGAISTCHMLSYLHVAREAGLVASSYRDAAEGMLSENAEGRMAVTRVTLRPQIEYLGRSPTADAAKHLHHAAHELCFIANSVKTEVVVEAYTNRP